MKPAKIPYKNEFDDSGPKRPPAEVKAEILRRRAKAKSFRQANAGSK